MRRPHDQYFTPASACEVLKAHWDGWKSCDVLVEPCVGDGDIVKAFPDCWWYTCDIDTTKNPKLIADMTNSFRWHDIKSRATTYKVGVITNPPFSHAYEFIAGALLIGCPVAALLRLSFLEPTKKRGMFLSNNPPDLVIVLPRISFTGDGKTDSVTCAWMIWDKDIKDKGVRVSAKS
jgi:hypothetical protein